jgi:hypothetical protein
MLSPNSQEHIFVGYLRDFFVCGSHAAEPENICDLTARDIIISRDKQPIHFIGNGKVLVFKTVLPEPSAFLSIGHSEVNYRWEPACEGIVYIVGQIARQNDCPFKGLNPLQ